MMFNRETYIEVVVGVKIAFKMGICYFGVKTTHLHKELTIEQKELVRRIQKHYNEGINFHSID